MSSNNDFSKEAIRHELSKFFTNQSANVMKIHTGLRGAQTFEWHIRNEARLWEKDQQRPAKLIAIMNYRREAVDINGEIWQWYVVPTGVKWCRQCAAYFQQKPERVVPTRFNDWEKVLPS